MLPRIQCVVALLVLCGAWSAAQEAYFPANAFGKEKRAQWEVAVDSYLLQRLEEPSLFKGAHHASAEAYRFLWLRTFHNPIAVRLELQPDGTSLLTIKVADGHAGFPRTVTKLIQSTKRSLSREQTDAFRTKVRAEGFWNSVSRDSGGPAATDCDGWILEAVKNGNYHVVERAVPNRLPKTTEMVQSIGLTLAIELGEMEIPKNER